MNEKNIRYGLRISFWVMLSIWILSIFINPNSYFTANLKMLLWFIFIITLIFTFIVSIVHLTKFKEKVFALTALVISSIGLILFIAGLVKIVLESI